MSAFKVEFRVFVRGEWPLGEELLRKDEQLVFNYLRNLQLNADDLRGGFFLEVEGQPYIGAESIGEARLSLSWLRAVREVLGGAGSAVASPRPDHEIRLRRAGGNLEIEAARLDSQSAASAPPPRAAVPLLSFAEDLLRESKVFSRYVLTLMNEIKDRRSQVAMDRETNDRLGFIEDYFELPVAREVAALKDQLAKAGKS